MDETTKFISHMCHAHNNLCEKKQFVDLSLNKFLLA